jgi:hypothetical protein
MMKMAAVCCWEATSGVVIIVLRGVDVIALWRELY